MNIILYWILFWNKVKVKSAQWCPTPRDPMDYTVHGILQARILKWVAFPFSRGSSQPREQPRSPSLQADSLPTEPRHSYSDTVSWWASLIAQLVKDPLQWSRPLSNSWVGKICWRRDRLPTPVFSGFPGSAGKESTCNAGNLGSVLVLGRSFGEGKGYPLQYSSLENSMDRRACQAIEHGVAKSQTWLSDFHFHLTTV